MIGLIGQGYWDLNRPQDINNLLIGADNWAGKKHSIVAFFFDIAAANLDTTFRGQLEALWQNGYTPFLNLMGPNMSSYDIASGNKDSIIRPIAASYAGWAAQTGSRKAFIAPLPEMNGYWTTYGHDPGNFKIAFDRIQRIFNEELTKKGAPASAIWWVFAPNGWSEAGHEFENYYPGDSKVDVVSFSSYNYGYCQVAIPWQTWDTAPNLYESFVVRMRTMAPSKPIIIAQTGTTGQYNSASINYTQKNQWLVDTYNYIASRPGVIAILYYDFNQSSWECDWTIYNTPAGVGRFDGYKTAVGNNAYQYVSPADLRKINLQFK